MRASNGAPVGLLRREVVRAPHEHVRAREARLPVGLHQAGDAEVGELDAAVSGQQHVLRLDVAVDHPLGVRVGERPAHLHADAHRLLGGQRALAAHEALQVLAVHQLHHEVGAVGVLAAVEQAHQVRVGEARHQHGLPAEALGVLLVGDQAGVQPLDRHGPPQHGVRRPPHRGHPSTADQLVQPVALPLDRSCHGRSPSACAIVTGGGYRRHRPRPAPKGWARLAGCRRPRPS